MDMTAGAAPSNRTVEVHRDDLVVEIALNRPERKNSLDAATVAELHSVLDTVRSIPSILVVRSMVPGVFVSGADIAELARRGVDDALSAINADLFARLAAHRWPTIAAVSGYALGGGCELAVACDLRVAATDAVFGQPEPSLGIVAGAGAHSRLPALTGLGVARQMLLAGRQLDAHEALAAGLVDQVVEPHELRDTAIALAHKITRSSMRALELTKLGLAWATPSTTRFDTVAQAICFESNDKRDRMNQFLTRRTSRTD